MEQILDAACVRGRGQVQRPRRESHPSSGCLDDLHNFEEQFPLDSEEVAPITGEEVGADLHIERTCTEAEESRMNRVALDKGTFSSRLLTPSRTERICDPVVS